MKILLSSANFCIEPLPVYPLGMSVIARVLKEAGHEVVQFDPLTHGRDGYAEAAKNLLSAFQPDLIGISVRNIDVTDSCVQKEDFLGSIHGVIRTWRGLFPGTIILGGPGFSMDPEALLAQTGADYGVAGEGEQAILDLVGAIEQGKSPAKGTIIRKEISLISGAEYSPEIACWYDSETHNMPIQTKRGCPFHCVYCTYPMLEGHAMRLRPVESVLDDLARLRDICPESMVYFTDSVFNDPTGHYKELLSGMVERKLTMPWTGFITPYKLTAEDIDLMAESGLICADLGLDGTTDETLRGLGKLFTFDEARACCQQLAARGIGINANAMFGGPGETWDTVARGIENMKSLEGVFSIIFAGIRVLSGAPLMETARRENMIPDGWNDTMPLYYYAPGLDAEKLHQTLLQGFANDPFCVYPPSSRSDDYRKLHKFGYAKLRAMQLERSKRRRKI